MILNYIRRWGSISDAPGSVDYLYIAITIMSVLKHIHDKIS